MPKSKPIKLLYQSQNPLVYLLVLVVTLAVGFFSGNFYSREQQYRQIRTATVTRIVDGDTVELDTGKLVRLNGIACPEKGEPFYQDELIQAQEQVKQEKLGKWQ